MLLEINSGYINKLPFSGLTKKSDLFSFDYNPVLSHYYDILNNDYLFYWIDFYENKNRWLAIRVSKDNLYYYLNDGITLRELIFVKPDNPYLFIINQDADGNFPDGFLILPENIPTEYLPNESSYFEYDFPKAYRDYFTEIDYVTKEMRKKALYLGIEATTSRYGKSVDPDDMIELIKNTKESYGEYAKEDFYQSYRDDYTEETLNRMYDDIKPYAKLRMCDVEFNSFKIALYSDVMNDSIDPKFVEWKNRIVACFKNDVIDYDFNSEADAKRISQKFPDEDKRMKIFAPIISLLESKRFNFFISNQAKTLKKKLTIGKKAKEIILPPKTLAKVLIEKFPEYDIIETYLQVPKGKKIDKPISPKKLEDMTLFSQKTDKFPIIFDKIEIGNLEFVLNQPIELYGSYKDGKYHILHKPLDIKIDTPNKEDLNRLFKEYFFDKYIETKNQNSIISMEFRKLIKSAPIIPDAPF